ncbi:MAG: hypothetical protein E6Q97_18300 [Desulfurellales bacterium]|nr:MAG: hypothetical protein E6Q97_18300 [Desulfurellales bacterium]
MSETDKNNVLKDLHRMYEAGVTLTDVLALAFDHGVSWGLCRAISIVSNAAKYEGRVVKEQEPAA